MATTGSERGLTLRSPGRFLAAPDRLVALYRQRPDPALRDQVVQAWIDAQAYQTCSRLQQVTAITADGARPGAGVEPEQAVVVGADVRLHETALALLGRGGRARRPVAAGVPVLAGRPDLRRDERGPAQRRGRARCSACRGSRDPDALRPRRGSAGAARRTADARRVRPARQGRVAQARHRRGRWARWSRRTLAAWGWTRTAWSRCWRRRAAAGCPARRRDGRGRGAAAGRGLRGQAMPGRGPRRRGDGRRAAGRRRLVPYGQQADAARASRGRGLAALRARHWRWSPARPWMARAACRPAAAPPDRAAGTLLTDGPGGPRRRLAARRAGALRRC